MSTRNRVVLVFTLLAFQSAGCGPELTDPSSVNASGRWQSDEIVSGIGSLVIDILQSPDGRVTGTWAGVIVNAAEFPCSPADAPCPPEGDLIGSHTTMQLFFDLEGIGSFTGQVVSPDSIRGTHTRGGEHTPVGFMRVP